ncbi:pirin family protein [Bizionia argentinensis JUB59]|uniref:Pirin family protein n=1 Tax=Bizionia argentinensis JUB59 TaxID=1046627 RepID=G2E9U4_9FLAO|nr:pirin family protein [Bizionia argentinensis]EGV45016.1 pirin family protein [Bizionia argentinensis JUB59]
MKTILYKAEDRGFANHGWLQANHSFSFANYFDKEKMNFGALRVLNDDVIAPKMGFGTHPHENMEIITIPLSGVLKHRDDMHQDWQSVSSDEVQVMSAGTGIQHSEINGSEKEHLNIFQIWITPNKQNVNPRYGQKKFLKEDRNNNLQILVISMDDSHEGSLKINQDAVISRIDLDADKTYNYTLKSNNHGVYIMNISGNVTIDSTTLETRDALGVSQTDQFLITANDASGLLFIEVPMS